MAQWTFTTAKSWCFISFIYSTSFNTCTAFLLSVCLLVLMQEYTWCFIVYCSNNIIFCKQQNSHLWRVQNKTIKMKQCRQFPATCSMCSPTFSVNPITDKSTDIGKKGVCEINRYTDTSSSFVLYSKQSRPRTVSKNKQNRERILQVSLSTLSFF